MEELRKFLLEKNMKNNTFTTTVKNHRVAIQEVVSGTEKHLEVFVELPEANSLGVDEACEKYEKFFPGEIFWAEGYFPWEKPGFKNYVFGWCVWANSQGILPSQSAVLTILTGILEKILG